jgi:uncharacterized protein with HEPN domain
MMECVEKIEFYFAERHNALIGDSIVYDAILRNLEVLSGCIVHLDRSLKRRHPRVRWSRIHGLKRVIGNQFLDEIDREVINQMIIDDLQMLKAVMLIEIPDWESIRHLRRKKEVFSHISL